MWTPAALSCEAIAYAGSIWRVVESQTRVSTMRLTDTLEEQKILEELVEESKPPMPSECLRLHWLLAAPFRYAPYPYGSRFRRAGQQAGAFYASESRRTALSEIAFYRLLFLLESPQMLAPAAPVPHSLFSARVRTKRALDLTRPPLLADAMYWTQYSDYAACQALGDSARAESIEVLRYKSVRDPQEGYNAVALAASAFSRTKPETLETWQILTTRKSVRALRQHPSEIGYDFPIYDFAGDPRLGLR